MSDDRIPSPSPAARRIGIWCVIDDCHRGHVTPEPASEFGACVSALLNELRTTDLSTTIVLWTTKSARPAYQAAFGATDVEVWPTPPAAKRPPVWVAFCLRDVLRGEAIGRRPEAWFGPEGRVVAAIKSLGGGINGVLRKGPLRLLRLPLLPILGIVLWSFYVVTMLVYAASQPACHPYRGLCRGMANLARRRLAADPVSYPTEPEVSDPPDIDAVPLWIAPSPLCTLPTTYPFILLVRDAALYASADRLDLGAVLTVDRHLQSKGPQALLIASPYRSVLEDLEREPLGLPAQKLRVCPAIVESKVGTRGAGHCAFLDGLRYLVCPSAFGPEKNVTTLIKAFAILRQHPGNRDLHLALIGPDEPLESHPALMANIHIHRLTPFVHLLGSLGAAEQTVVVQGAQVAVFPALYETSAAAIEHALACECPIACAAISGFQGVVERLGDECVSFEPHDPRVVADALLRLLSNRASIRTRQIERWLRPAKLVEPPIAWRELIEEADSLRRLGPQRLYSVADDAPYRLSLVLPQPIPGGTWESAREIVEGLALVNRRRRLFDLQFIHHPDQPNLDKLQIAPSDLVCVPRVLDSLPSRDVQRLLSADVLEVERLAFFSELDRETLLEQDALFFLAFGFPAKLAPVRPYGVMVLDMVLFQLADQFPASVREMCQTAIRPTLEAAELLIATSEATRALLRHHCTIDETKAVLTPLGCETYRRLVDATPIAIEGLDRPFLLNITNHSPHKGAATVVDAFAELKGRLGENCPTLVFAGCHTDAFLPGATSPPTAYVADIRARIVAAGLVPGRDVVGLGLISDGQAAWLYQNCRAVLNAAQADNGTYCLIEGRYFGRSIISSDYPAARCISDRFLLPVRYFPVGDAAALGIQMEAALGDRVLVGDELNRERQRLEADEFSRARFVERLYDHLLILAQTGRRQRNRAAIKLPHVQQRSLVRMAESADLAMS